MPCRYFMKFPKPIGSNATTKTRPPGGSVVVFGGAVQTKTVQNHDLDWLWSFRVCNMLGGAPNDAKTA